MFSLDVEQAKALNAICSQHAVRRLKLFGSATDVSFDPKGSDLDFLVEFYEPPSGMRLSTQFFGLMEELQTLFQQPIDLLEESAIENSRLLRNAQAGAVTLYIA